MVISGVGDRSLPSRGVSASGMGCLPLGLEVSTCESVCVWGGGSVHPLGRHLLGRHPLVDRILDTGLWKYYPPATTAADDKYEHCLTRLITKLNVYVICWPLGIKCSNSRIRWTLCWYGYSYRQKASWIKDGDNWIEILFNVYLKREVNDKNSRDWLTRGIFDETK